MMTHILAVAIAATATIACFAQSPVDRPPQPAWDPAGRTIELETIIPASRAEVYQAWTTNDGARTFFSTHVNIELRLGGAYEIYFAPDAPYGERGSEGCRILALIENEMLAFTWNAPPNFPDMRSRRTFVVIRFDHATPEQVVRADAGGGLPTDVPHTRVRLTHGGWDSVKTSPQAEAVFNYFDRVWPLVLANLKKRFETGPLFGEVGTHQPPPAMTNFVIFIRPSREAMLTEGPTASEREALTGHAAYIKNLLAQGRLLFAGPAQDPVAFPRAEGGLPLDLPTPGLIVFKARDLGEAQEIMEGDPAIAAGVFKARVNAFTLSFWNR